MMLKKFSLVSLSMLSMLGLASIKKVDAPISLDPTIRRASDNATSTPINGAFTPDSNYVMKKGFTISLDDAGLAYKSDDDSKKGTTAGLFDYNAIYGEGSFKTYVDSLNTSGVEQYVYVKASDSLTSATAIINDDNASFSSTIRYYGFRATASNLALTLNDAISHKGSVVFEIGLYHIKSQVTDGQTVDIAINVDSAPTIDEILSNVTAKDLLGENVEVQCSDTEKAKYNPNKLGAYKVAITATDKYGQTSTCYLNLKVLDLVAPSVALATGKNLNFLVGSKLVFANVGSFFTITDNGTSKGGTIGTPTYKLDDKAFDADKTFTPADVGTHKLSITVADSSGNVTAKDFTLNVTDGQAPVISRRDGGEMAETIKMGVSRVINLTKADFLAIFKAVDDVDGDVSSTLTVEGDFLPNRVGNYQVRISAHDKANNYTKTGDQVGVIISIQILADLPPVFILSDKLVQATTDQPLSSAQIQKMIAVAWYSDMNVEPSDVKINDTEYQNNRRKAGTYPVSYSVRYTDKDTGELIPEDKVVDVQVTQGNGGTETDVTSPWYEKFWEKLINWFRGVFTKWQWNCFITNEQWDIRFPKEEETPVDSTTTTDVPSDSVSK